MRVLNVLFMEPDCCNATASLTENLITDELCLELSRELFGDEIYRFIEIAKKRLEPRYSDIEVKIFRDCSDNVKKGKDTV